MRIAVIIPTYDRPQLLREALESVARQTRVPDEVNVVVDAGPRLDALELELSGRLPLHVHYAQTNRGQAACRNLGITRTDADAVAFLDDDDTFEPRHLERTERALRQHTDAALVYDDAEVRRHSDEDAIEGAFELRVIAREYDPALMRSIDYVPPSCWLVRRDALARCGGFDASFRIYEDWDLLLRLEAWGSIRRTPGIGACIGIRATSSANQSARFDEARVEALRRFREKHGLGEIEPMTFWEVAGAVGAKGPLDLPPPESADTIRANETESIHRSNDDQDRSPLRRR